MPPQSPTEQQRRQKIVLLIAMSGGLMLTSVVGVLVAFIALDSEDRAAEAHWIEAHDVPSEAVAPAPAPTPEPSPLSGTEGGYGRPGPLFGSGDDAGSGGAAPLHIDPADPPDIPGVETRTIEIPTAGGAVHKGSLPGRWGNPHARIQMVVYNDFECPYCSRVDATFTELHTRYGSDIELWFRDYPLAFHKNARSAHLAARCAHDQGHFWAMHDLIFANQRAMTTEDLAGYAAELDLDPARFDSCLQLEHHAAAVDADIAAAKAAGVTGTPTTFVNGNLVRGATSVDKFVEAIEASR